MASVITFEPNRCVAGWSTAWPRDRSLWAIAPPQPRAWRRPACDPPLARTPTRC